MLFKFNYNYHLHVLFNKNINSSFKYNLANELSAKLQKLMTIYQNNLFYGHKLWKQVYNKLSGLIAMSLAPKFYLIINISKLSKFEI